jgi:hypothetical protein
VLCISQHAAAPNGISSPSPAGIRVKKKEKKKKRKIRVLGVPDGSGMVTSDNLNTAK